MSAKRPLKDSLDAGSPAASGKVERFVLINDRIRGHAPSLSLPRFSTPAMDKGLSPLYFRI